MMPSSQKLAPAKDTPTVFYEIDATDPTKPYTSGPGTFIDLVIRLAGGKNIGAELKDAFAQISSEELVKQNPDIIVLGDALYGVTPESRRAATGLERAERRQRSSRSLPSTTT